MNTSQNKMSEKSEANRSFKNAMYTSIIFVGGGLGFFWVLLLIIFSIRS